MQQTFIMLVGYSVSGKTPLAEEIQKAFPGEFTRMNSREVHEFLNSTYEVFQDDNTIEGKAFKVRQKATDSIHNALLFTLISEGYSVILDSCNQVKQERNGIIERIKRMKPEIKIAMIYVKVDENEHQKNLKELDAKLAEEGQKPVWVDLYEKVQKSRLNEPTETEAENFFVYDKKNLKEIIKQIGSITQ